MAKDYKFQDEPFKMKLWLDIKRDLLDKEEKYEVCDKNNETYIDHIIKEVGIDNISEYVFKNIIQDYKENNSKEEIISRCVENILNGNICGYIQSPEELGEYIKKKKLSAIEVLFNSFNTKKQKDFLREYFMDISYECFEEVFDDVISSFKKQLEGFMYYYIERTEKEIKESQAARHQRRLRY